MNQEWLLIEMSRTMKPFVFQLRRLRLYRTRLPRKAKKRLAAMGINWKTWPEEKF